MRAQVFVTLKNGVFDPAGKSVEQALHSLGFSEASGVRLGKYIELQVDAASAEKAQARVEQMCEKLLANGVVENYRVEIAK